MNTGEVQGYLLTNFKEDTKENRKKVFEYLKTVCNNKEDFKYLGQYWVDCVFFYKNNK
tara:strand:+ start:2852 stop:3025 length:174 start_codon:yes stop_codon:yes gene_type:complete